MAGVSCTGLSLFIYLFLLRQFHPCFMIHDEWVQFLGHWHSFSLVILTWSLQNEIKCINVFTAADIFFYYLVTGWWSSGARRTRGWNDDSWGICGSAACFFVNWKVVSKFLVFFFLPTFYNFILFTWSVVVLTVLRFMTPLLATSQITTWKLLCPCWKDLW